uniref:Uncharacterized protein n=1 Tax=Triticum urartu TaxID=4572 RepID=A0A8R7QI49_TRIUA
MAHARTHTVPEEASMHALVSYIYSSHWGYWWMHSIHGPSASSPPAATSSATATRSHTRLLALSPLPMPRCHTVSPLRTRALASRYAIWYHSDAADWFPNRWNVISAASISLSPSPSPFPSRSIIGFPEEGRQKWSDAARKFGIGAEAPELLPASLSCPRWRIDRSSAAAKRAFSRHGRMERLSVRRCARSSSLTMRPTPWPSVKPVMPSSSSSRYPAR